MAMKQSFEWLPAQMPRVAVMMKERRRLHGDAFVNQCWKQGVLAGKPGFFFAREGALAVGTPWADDPVMINFAAASVTAGQAVLCMAKPEVKHGPQ